MILSLSLACLLAPASPAASSLQSPPSGHRAPDETGEVASVLDRVAVVGASASAGFQLGREVGGHTNLADVLDAMIQTGGSQAVDAASSSLFMDPRRVGAGCVERALEAKPTLVLALDFLFWFTYGRIDSEAERLALLDEGLVLLDRFPCPILLTEIPDMSASVGKMLSRRSVPSEETMKAANARIRSWAKKRKRAILVPMSSFLDRVRRGEEVRLGEYVLPEGSTRRVLQPDELHPTLQGLASLAVLAFHTLREESPHLIPEESVLWDPVEISALVFASREPERKAAEERRLERERRRAEREKADAR